MRASRVALPGLLASLALIATACSTGPAPTPDPATSAPPALAVATTTHWGSVLADITGCAHATSATLMGPGDDPHEFSTSSAEVATHNSAGDCWTSINGKVYDVTDWEDKHPGGAERIIALCGTDGSSAFDDQHAGEPKPEDMLAEYQIGVLAQ